MVKVLYALLLSSLFLLPNSVLAEDRTYTFAVVPQQAITELAECTRCGQSRSAAVAVMRSMKHCS